MTKHKALTLAITALFTLGLVGTAVAQTATPATPPAKADKGQTMKQKKAEGDKGRANAMEQGKKKGAEKGKKTGYDKAKKTS